MKALLGPRVRGSIASSIAHIALVPGVIVALEGCLVFIRQVREWVKTGVWIPRPVFDSLHKYLGVEHPEASGTAVQKIADLLLRAPLSLSLILLGFLLAVGTARIVTFVLHHFDLAPADEILPDPEFPI
jgi:hypothetical protein